MEAGYEGGGVGPDLVTTHNVRTDHDLRRRINTTEGGEEAGPGGGVWKENAGQQGTSLFFLVINF